MKRPVISVQNVSKSFNIYRRPVDLFLSAVSKQQRHDVFWALRNIDLKITEGERVGIVGPNGAGKSTFLKIVTGNLEPTEGAVEINGKISSMLSLTSFLDNNETGLDNIRYNLLLNGTPRNKIQEITEEIIDFTELGSFITAPVRTYSSGMNARLAFAISTSATPDILVVDEVLGVGDGYFVSKATQRMMDLCRRGRALIYVSHALSAIQMLCTRVLWLDQGTIRMDGAPDQVLKAYEEDYRRQEDIATREGNRNLSIITAGEVEEDDLADQDLWRLRLVGPEGKRFSDVHYISRISVEIEGSTREVDLSRIDTDKPGPGEARLDLLESEWGRFHDHQGVKCRMLTALTGRKKGGRISIGKTTSESGSEVPIHIVVERASNADIENMVLEILDEESGLWRTIHGTKKKAAVKGKKLSGACWRITEFSSALTVGRVSTVKEVRKKLARDALPDVIITDAWCEKLNSEHASFFDEGEPYRIVLEAEVIRAVPSVDFGVRIFRADGTYVFWQSSGQTSGNIKGVPGHLRVAFEFSQNLFSAGRYDVTVYAANGWDLKNNYPYSHVYMRRINLIRYTIRRKDEQLDFGLVNVKVPTTIEEVNENSVSLLNARAGES